MLLILLIIAVVIIYFFYRKRKLGLGLIIATPIILLVTYCLFMNSFDALFISKSDVKQDLKIADIIISEDFEILENSVVGFPERFQKTKLKISETDFSRIILEIKNASDFKNSHDTWLLQRKSIENNIPKNEVVISNYGYRNSYVREGYFQQGDYVPSYIIATLNPTSKILEYERIED